MPKNGRTKRFFGDWEPQDGGRGCGFLPQALRIFLAVFGAFFESLATVYGGGKKAFTDRLRTVNEAL